MDNITHAVMGAAIGEALAGRSLGKKAMLWGAIAANIPDIDVFFATFQSVPDSLLSHRGLTHSILFCVLAAFLISRFMRRWKYSGSVDFKLWMILISSALFSHILIDACTSYGTGWFEPFSHYRVSFNNLFVVDPFYTLPLLISFIALLILRSNKVSRKWWNAFGISVSTSYLLFTFISKANADRTVRANLLSGKIESNEFLTTPTPLNSFLWYIIIKSNDGFYVSYHSIFDKTEQLNLRYYPQNGELIVPYNSDEGVMKLMRFSEGYYCITKDSSNVDFHILRFGEIGGWYSSKPQFAFSYHLAHNADNALVIQRGRINIASKQAIRSLIGRIQGR